VILEKYKKLNSLITLKIYDYIIIEKKNELHSLYQIPTNNLLKYFYETEDYLNFFYLVYLFTKCIKKSPSYDAVSDLALNILSVDSLCKIRSNF